MLATSPRKRGEVKTVAASNSLDISDAFPGPSSALGSEGWPAAADVDGAARQPYL